MTDRAQKTITDRPQKIRGGIGADDRYWEALGNGEFRLCRCAQCERWMTPAHYRCGACGSWEQKWPLVEPVGQIYSWTRTHMSFPRTPERKDDVPYVSVLVEIDNTDGSRIFGMFDETTGSPRIGDKVVGQILAPTEKSLGYPSIIWKLAEGTK